VGTTAKAAKSPRRRSSRAPSNSAGTQWFLRRTRGLKVLESRPLVRFSWLVHGFSTRPGGGSRLNGSAALNLGYTDWDTRESVQANRARFLAAIGGSGMQLIPLRQVHSDIVHQLDAPPLHALRGDAAISRAPGLLLAVQTADCLPILLVDAKRRAIAAIHAGWRGTLKRIAQKALGRMRMAYGTSPADVLAAIGPGIGRCCYEVGPEVAQAYASQFASAAEWFDGPLARLTSGEEPNPLPWLSMAPPGHEPPPARVRLDLRAASRWQLLDVGVPAANIFASELCTACRPDLLFSYRREAARTGRMMAVIGLRGK
jgi:purine-nucleoside/S-methyl-5'-thioadenosine phosphorylase / adenosine deaminase